jgi:hypothetical protein
MERRRATIPHVSEPVSIWRVRGLVGDLRVPWFVTGAELLSGLGFGPGVGVYGTARAGGAGWFA